MIAPAEIETESMPAQAARDFVRRMGIVEESIRTLFGPASPQLRDFRATAAGFRDEWAALANNRGLSLPALAMIGERGTGKTTLIRLLTGATPPTTAGRIQWIGPQQPATLDPQFEEYRRVDAADMPDLGTPCLLIDTPDLDPAAPDNAALFHRLFTTTRFKVVILQQEKLESSFWQHKLAGYGGSVVLPVIRLDPETTHGYPDNLPKLHDAWQRDHEPGIRANLAGIELESPVFLPHLDAMGGRETSVATVKDALSQRLRDFLASRRGATADRLAELDASWLRFLETLRPLTSAFDTPLLAERFHDLEQAIDALPETLIHHLLADERRIRALIRMDLRSRLMDHVPAWAFPFRSLCGLLCLTTGLWDRLILGATGSLPSTVLTVAGAVRNRTEEIRAEKSHRHGMDAAMRTLVRTRLALPWNGFIAALEKAGDARTDDSLGGDFEIEGDDQLTGLWKQALADATRKHPDKPERGDAFVFLLSTLGALAFWLLFLGPLLQTYGQYLPAAMRSLTGSWTAENLNTYPAPGGAFWFSAVILSLIPPFFIALILVAIRLGGHRISRCVARLATHMRGHLDHGTLSLRIHPTDPRVKAYRELTTHRH